MLSQSFNRARFRKEIMNKGNISVIFIALFTLYYYFQNNSKILDDPLKSKFSLEELKVVLEEAYVESNKILLKSQSAKSFLELHKGIEYIKKALALQNKLTGGNSKLPKITLPQSESVKTDVEVCTEKYGGSLEDHPYYLKNIPLNQNCNVSPISTVVTVILNFVSEISYEKAETIFEDIAYSSYRSVSYIAYFPPGNVNAKLKQIVETKIPNMEIVKSEYHKSTHFSELSEALSHVSTKYVIIARNTERFDNFSTIERMIREISLGKTQVIGGAHRNSSGHWRAGCYQVKISHGKLKFDEGYDFSDNSCMYCDYASGPFGTRKDLLQSYLSSSNKNTRSLSGDFLYLDFFLHVRLSLKKNVFVCFDAMFYTETSGLQAFTKTKWLSFVSKHHLGKVTLTEQSGFTYEFSCEEACVDCNPHKNKQLSVCCLKEAERLLKAIMEKLRKNNIPFKFLLPDISKALLDRHVSIPSKNTMVLIIPELDMLKTMFKDHSRFSLRKVNKNVELIYKQWRVIFNSSRHTQQNCIDIRLGSLVLPIVGDIGKTLANEDKCIECFNILHEYSSLKTQRVWV